MGSTTCKWTPGIERLAGRHTPTMNDGSFQRLVIELSCARALSIGMLLEDFDLAKSIQHFDAACGSRHKFEESPVIARVSDALKNVEEADCCIIVASNITHIGVDPKKIIFAKSILRGMHPNARFVSLKEYGLNFEHAAEITFKYYAALKHMLFETKNPGKYVEILQDDLACQI